MQGLLMWEIVRPYTCSPLLTRRLRPLTPLACVGSADVSSCLGMTHASVTLPPSSAGPKLRLPEITRLPVVTLTYTVITVWPR